MWSLQRFFSMIFCFRVWEAVDDEPIELVDDDGPSDLSTLEKQYEPMSDSSDDDESPYYNLEHERYMTMGCRDNTEEMDDGLEVEDGDNEVDDEGDGDLGSGYDGGNDNILAQTFLGLGLY